MKATSLIFVFAMLVLILVAVPASLAVQESDAPAALALDSPQASPEAPPIIWDKTVNGVPWTSGLSVTLQTSDTIQIVETLFPIVVGPTFAQVERWDPARLMLLDWTFSGGVVVLDPTGSLTWIGEITSLEPLTLIKMFHVEPCTWTQTLLEEELWIDGVLAYPWPVEIHKLPPVLAIDAVGGGPTLPGAIVSFTLLYSNTGGYENAALIRNEFPPEAPFLGSIPQPDRVDPTGLGLWAEWDLGDLAQGAAGAIDVTVQVAADLPVSTTVEVWDGIYDHAGELQDWVITSFHVEEPPIIWDKMVDGIVWTPGLTITRQTSDTIQIVETLFPSPLGLGRTFAQVERWDPARLMLLDWAATGGALMIGPTGVLTWSGEIISPEPLVLTKMFHVEPCTWTQTLLDEELWQEDALLEVRPVKIRKLPPVLAIDAVGGGPTLPGAIVSFTLLYSNTGGYENAALIRNEFPPEAPFLGSIPQPDRVDPTGLGLWAEWDLGDLAQGAAGAIDVTVQVGAGLPVSTTVEVWDGIYDHAGELQDWVIISFHIEEPLIIWDKMVDGIAWTPGLSVTVQTSDTIQIVETLFPSPLGLGRTFAQVERWDPARLMLLDWTFSGGVVVLDPTGVLTWSGEIISPEPLILTKMFHVEPCTWTQTLLEEELWFEDSLAYVRPVEIQKLPPVLELDAEGGGPALPGAIVSFTLLYSNTGGYENAVLIRNTFPQEAPFLGSVPPADRVDPTGLGLWAEWDVGDLAQGAADAIDVTVQVGAGLPVSTTVEVWDGIYDHAGELQDWVVTSFHIEEPPIIWDKMVDGIVWTPGLSVTVQTSDTIQIVETLFPSPLGLGRTFAQVERWDPARLMLLDWTFSSGVVVLDPTGVLTWSGEIISPEPLVLTKMFHVEPCTWTQTLLDEELWQEDALLEVRPVKIRKLPPVLAIDAEGGGTVYPGQPVPFTLIYTNTGGYENDVMVRNTFPPEAPFLRSSPPPDRTDPAGLWAEWDVGDLAQDATGTIDVTVQVAYGLPVSTTFEVWDGIYDHAGELQGDVWIPFHVALLPVIWTKTVDGAAWEPGMDSTVQTSDTIQVVETLTPVEFGHTFVQTERWDPTRLDLIDFEVSTGVVVVDPTGGLSWSTEIDNPMPYVLTKWFHVKPCTWTDTFLEESLWMDDVLLEERPVDIHKLPPALSIRAESSVPTYPGQAATFRLIFANSGGYENDVEIRNTFPPEAPFLVSSPPPTRVDVNGLWAQWDVGDLAQGAEGRIDVMVYLAYDTPVSTTLSIWDGIYDHVNILRDEVQILLHVDSPITWQKTVGGAPWVPGLTVTRQTSDTLEVVETLQILPGIVPASAATALQAADSTAPAAVDSVLWDQIRSSNLFFASQDFVNDAMDIYAADDFENLTPWALGAITTQGGWPDGPVDLLNASELHWYIYADDGGDPAGVPGDGLHFWHLSLPPTDPRVSLGSGLIGTVRLSLSEPINLPPGTWWLVFYPSLDYSLYGRYGWQGAPGQVWRECGQQNNPLGPYPGWNDNPNNADYSFRLEGLAAPLVPFAQVERWDTTRLKLLTWSATGGAVTVRATGALTLSGEITVPTTIVLTKRFHVEPCTWAQTTLDEELWLGGNLLEERPVVIRKLAPVLNIDATGGGEVLPAKPGSFTLNYGNTGGYENDVWIRSTFPVDAPFQTSTPLPTRVDSNKLWAEWDLGDLAQGALGSIDVTVSVSVGARPLTTLQVINVVYDHVDVERDRVTVDFQIAASPDFRRHFYLPIVLRRDAP